MMLPWQKLRRMGIVGMNQRNADYIMVHNPRRFYPMVDDKLLTKKLALQAGIAVPDLYGVIEVIHDLKSLGALLENYQDFVIKPAHGSGGRGILVMSKTKQGRYRKSSGQIMTEDDIAHYISNILGGEYSLGGVPDVAMIEYQVKFNLLFESISYQGVPDIRVIVFRGLPVMAMLRLPTRISDGKANLHQGAVGAGIDIGTGVILSAVCRDSLVYEHPDTGNSISGLKIPDWDTILELAAGCADLVGIGYMGVDVVLDRDLGPLVLELNARPGLAIQLANQAGLLSRLRTVEDLDSVPPLPAERAQMAKQNFSVESMGGLVVKD